MTTHSIQLHIASRQVDIVFRPVLPSWNPKYVKNIDRHVPFDITEDRRSILNHKIPPFASMTGNFPLETAAEPGDWVACLHPEGDSYQYHSVLQIVTNSNPLQSVVTRDILQAAYGSLISLVPNSADRLDEGFEIYLQLDGDPTSSPVIQIQYYFVDFAARQIFWAEEIDVARMGLEPFVQRERLKSALTPDFWVHVEYFPCHRALEAGVEEELVSTLKFGYVDDMTAPGSVSPYGAQQSSELLKALHGFPAMTGDLPNAPRTAIVARLWGGIAQARHINGYGTKSPRLDRLQGLSDFVRVRTTRSVCLALAEAICLYQSYQRHRRMNGLWNGRVVYERHWRAFFEETRRDWMVLGVLGLVFWIASAMALFHGNLTSVPLMSSTAFGMTSVLVSLFLLDRHSQNRLSTPSQISSYIAKIENYDHGLRGVSIIYSLPHALTGYSALLLQLGLMTRLGVLDGPLNTLAMWFWPFITAFILILVSGGWSVM